MELDIAGGEAILKPHTHRQKHARSSTRTAGSEFFKPTAEANLASTRKQRLQQMTGRSGKQRWRSSSSDRLRDEAAAAGKP
ncbi:BnaC09g31200D [Brassica napus]|uniref:(rape) hypothetical protein n=1 Tax=Brassica napus TaxID=3708 RepID=A0A078G350_BRANA|nr:unnamed protein product [Brassica napus]CDY19854.1 BnaC09g31200D [Brassica napus]